MKRYQPGARMDRKQQRGNVAETDQRFGIGRDRIEIHQRQYPRRAPAAADAVNGVNLGVFEHRVEICGAILITPAKIAVAVIDVLAELGLQAEHGDGFQQRIKIGGFPDHPGWRDQPEGVAGLEPLGLDNAARLGGFCARTEGGGGDSSDQCGGQSGSAIQCHPGTMAKPARAVAHNCVSREFASSAVDAARSNVQRSTA
jgi:hypothetical protein